MPCFYAEDQQGRVRLTGADALHLARSLRARPGERIEVIDAAPGAREGRLLTVRLDRVDRDLVEGEVVAERPHAPEPERRVEVALAMLPASELDEALARCTELGAAGFYLVAGARSVARGGNHERWARICRESAMLAGRVLIPTVRPPASLVEVWQGAAHPLMLHRGGGPLSVAAAGNDPVTVFIGPEGGWSEPELDLAGAALASLGPRNLRAATAAIAAVAAILTG